MKNRFLGAAVAVSVLVGMAAPARADGNEVVNGMGKKLARGFVDTFTGIVEWPVQTYKGWKNGVSFIKNETGSKVTGSVIGFLFTGPSHTIGRVTSGARELFGFWTANPKDNEGVGTPLDAEYAWEEGTRHSIFDPNFTEGGLKPWGNKLVRGLGNGVGGILELPGQIVKGVRQDKVGTGIVKGIWYPLSRFAYGISDAVTFLFPNHKDNPGHAFEEKWPWDAFSADSAK